MWLFSVSGLVQDVCEHGDACADGVMGGVAEAEDELRWLRGSGWTGRRSCRRKLADLYRTACRTLAGS